MNRRSFLGRAAVGAVAAPVVAKEAVGMIGDGVPFPGLGSTVLYGTEDKPWPAEASAIQNQIDELYQRNYTQSRISKREMKAMKSWSPVFRDYMRRKQAEERHGVVDKLKAQLHELLETK
jgi:hypothetical protein